MIDCERGVLWQQPRVSQRQHARSLGAYDCVLSYWQRAHLQNPTF
jgi:hypothetical protein